MTLPQSAWLPLVTAGAAQPPISPQTVVITSDYSQFGEGLAIDGSPGFKVIVRDGAFIDVLLDGANTVSSASGDVVGLITTNSLHGAAVISVENSFAVSATGDHRNATGFALQGVNDRLQQDNALDVTSASAGAMGVAMTGGSTNLVNNLGDMTVTGQTSAIGVFTDADGRFFNAGRLVVESHGVAVGFYDQTPAPPPPAPGAAALPGSFTNFDNRGEIDVHAGHVAGDGFSVAAGFVLSHGTFNNAGSISVSGQGYVVGGQLFSMDDAVNQAGGVISARASGPDGVAVGLLVGSNFGTERLFNGGLIRADTAISAYSPGGEGQPMAGALSLVNDGRILGDIRLGDNADIIFNYGVIHGDVMLGGGDDVFDGRAAGSSFATADGVHGESQRVVGDISGGAGDDTLTGSRHGDLIHGDDAAGVETGADLIAGYKGDDSLDGGAGDDHINGGRGADQLTGGLGADTFAYARTGDSTTTGLDLITDLDNGDIIDLSRIDADTTNRSGDDAFHLVSSFTVNAGELTVSYDALIDQTVIAGDVDGDGTADLVITVTGDHSDFTNFVL